MAGTHADVLLAGGARALFAGNRRRFRWLRPAVVEDVIYFLS